MSISFLSKDLIEDVVQYFPTDCYLIYHNYYTYRASKDTHDLVAVTTKLDFAIQLIKTEVVEKLIRRRIIDPEKAREVVAGEDFEYVLRKFRRCTFWKYPGQNLVSNSVIIIEKMPLNGLYMHPTY